MNHFQWWAKESTKQEQEKKLQKLYKDYGFDSEDENFLSNMNWLYKESSGYIRSNADFIYEAKGFAIYCAIHDDVYREFVNMIPETERWSGDKLHHKDYFVDIVKKIKNRYNELWYSESMKLAILVKEFGHKDKKDEISDKASSSIFENLSK